MDAISGTATYSVTLDVPPDRAWQILRAFGHVSEWHPIAEASRIVDGRDGQPGAERELTLADGGTVRERLVAIDDRSRALTYRMLTFPIPVTAQENTITVTTGETADGSRVTFGAKFVPALGHTAEEIEAINRGAFQVAARGLEQRLQQREQK